MARRLAQTLLGLGAALALVGAVAPWIPHRAAGLSVGGFYLFEMSKFLPAVRSGAVPLFREAFLLPLLASAVALALAPAFSRGAPRGLRWLGSAAGALTALAALPPYPAILTAHQTPDYRGQLYLAVGAFLLALFSILAVRLPRRLLDGLLSALAVAGLVPALVALARVRPLFAELYGEPIGIGWGVVSCVAGCAAVLAATLSRKR